MKGPLAARFAALRVRPTARGPECWLLAERPLTTHGERKACLFCDTNRETRLSLHRQRSHPAALILSRLKHVVADLSTNATAGH
jgi:hypothetical protein